MQTIEQYLAAPQPQPQPPDDFWEALYQDWLKSLSDEERQCWENLHTFTWKIGRQVAEQTDRMILERIKENHGQEDAGTGHAHAHRQGP